MTTLEILQSLSVQEIIFFKAYKGDIEQFKAFLIKQFPNRKFELRLSTGFTGEIVNIVLTEPGLRGFYYSGQDILDCYAAAIKIANE